MGVLAGFAGEMEGELKASLIALSTDGVSVSIETSCAASMLVVREYDGGLGHA